ncbi:MAG: CoA-binding protein [Candidatus Verstraetearchaeota archaeon]|nr:CoA-binding protein [Candidatus Verstraetearchaeota archaeon]
MSRLDVMFSPRSIAVIGASKNPKKIGYELVSNILTGGYEGNLYPVNPEGADVMGLKSYTSVKEIRGEVDLAVIAVPAAYVPDILDECGQKGIKAALIISSGFREVGNIELEERLVQTARRYGMRILGPNIFGLYYAPSRMNATFGLSRVFPGKIAFVTQSGALGIAMMGWTNLYRIGVSAVVSMGNKADIEEADVLDYFSEDRNTRAVLMYIEGAKDGRRLLESMRRSSLSKPVIVLKSGRTGAGASAASSHTGSLAGSDAVYDAAFRQCGALRASDLAQAFDWAKLMTLQPPPMNDNCLIITNGGGVGVMAADACEESGVPIRQLPDDLQLEFKRLMPVFGNSKNPVDLTGQAYEESYARSVELALKDSRIGSVIVLYCQTAITDPVSIAKAIADGCEAHGCEKTVVTSFIGGSQCNEAMQKLDERGVPSYPIPERAVSALAAYYRWQRYRLKKGRPSPTTSSQAASQVSP